MAILNDIIRHTDNDIGRLRLDREISRPRKKADLKNDAQRSICKEKLLDGAYTPWEFIQAISHTIDHINADIADTIYPPANLKMMRVKKLSCLETVMLSVSQYSNMDIYALCSARILELDQPCPVCRSEIDDRFQVFTN